MAGISWSGAPEIFSKPFDLERPLDAIRGELEGGM
jgi:hypothetical protein